MTRSVHKVLYSCWVFTVFVADTLEVQTHISVTRPRSLLSFTMILLGTSRLQVPKPSKKKPTALPGLSIGLRLNGMTSGSRPFGSDVFISQGRFKLHLTDRTANNNIAIRPLPLNKTVLEVFADFLEYLFKCASAYLEESYGTGWWASVQYQVEFVLSHPNGWRGAQQEKMRRAAILAGLVPDTTAGHARLSFVTEGEASLHFAIHNGLPTGAINNGEGIVIVDAGGGTIDISSYCKNVGGDKFDEVAAPQCEKFRIAPYTLFAF